MGSSRSSRSPLKRHHHKNKHKKRGKDRNRRKNGVHGSDRSEEKYRNTISINKKNKCRVSINHEFEKDVRETRHSKYRKQTYIANSSSDSQDSEEYCTYSVDKKRKRQKEIETSLEQINRTKRQEDEERQLGNSFRRESLFIKNMDFKHLSCDTKLPVVVEIAAKTDEFDFAVGLPDIEIPQTDDENGTDFSAGSSDEYVPDSDDDALALADELDNSVIKTADVVLEEIADCGDTYINNKNENGRNILTRKTKIKSHKWVQNKRKYHRSKGNPYVTKSGRRVEERVPKPIDRKCRHNCTEIFSEEEHRDQCRILEFRRLFLANCVKIEKCKRTLTIGSRRANTFNYTLKAKQIIKDETSKRIELLVQKRVEEELIRRKDEIEKEVMRRVEAAKSEMERELMFELEKQREQIREEARHREEFEKKKREELEDIFAENNRRIEEAQRKLAEERLAMIEEQRLMEEKRQRMRKEEEKRVKEEQKMILGKNNSRPKLSFSLRPGVS